MFEGLEEDFAGAGDAVEHAGAADEEFGHEVVELAGVGDVDAFVVGGVGGEDFVDPGVFVPGLREGFGEEWCDGFERFGGIEGGSGEEGVVDFWEGCGVGAPAGEGEAGEGAGVGVVDDVGGEVGVAGALDGTGEEDDAEFSGVFLLEGFEVFVLVAAGVAGVVEVFDEDVGCGGVAEVGEGVEVVDFVGEEGDFAAGAALVDGFGGGGG